MQSKDNDYYLHRNIDGAEDINGTLFLDYRANLQKQSANYIIYGHNPSTSLPPVKRFFSAALLLVS